MKVTIELNDEDLHRSIGQQIDAAVSQQTGAIINARIEDILAKKFERMDGPAVDAIVRHAAAVLVGEHARQAGGAYQIVQAAAFDAMKAAIKESKILTGG